MTMRWQQLGRQVFLRALRRSGRKILRSARAGEHARAGSGFPRADRSESTAALADHAGHSRQIRDLGAGQCCCSALECILIQLRVQEAASGGLQKLPALEGDAGSSPRIRAGVPLCQPLPAKGVAGHDVPERLRHCRGAGFATAAAASGASSETGLQSPCTRCGRDAAWR